MDFLRPAGTGHSGKTDADIGNERIIVIDVEVNALEVDVGIMVVKHGYGLGKDRRQRYPVVTQHKCPGDIFVKVSIPVDSDR